MQSENSSPSLINRRNKRPGVTNVIYVSFHCPVTMTGKMTDEPVDIVMIHIDATLRQC
jgi:hypothetical protein